MLARIDKALAVAAWVVAGVLALMLFIGPQVVAEDEEKPREEAPAGSSPYAGGRSVDAKAVFGEKCGSCHTFGEADTTGLVGPSLDDTDLDAAGVEAVIRDGRGGMPALGGELSDEEVAAVAAFVAGAR